MPAAKFTHEQIIKRAFLRVARVLHEHLEEESGPHSRLFDILLNHMDKEDLVVGNSVAALATGSRRQEHVVPCAFIIRQCRKFFEQGKSEGKPEEEVKKEVAEYIEAKLKIVLITQEERKRLDSLPGLKDKMPPGWKDGDDIMARLNFAGIRYVLRTRADR